MKQIILISRNRIALALAATVTLVAISIPLTSSPVQAGNPTPVPAIGKVPEGNANNTDLDVPAANLWLCTTGACAGPGEGNLLVHEYASDVVTGDFDGNTVVDGLGAYELTLEFDNFVIASIIPVDIVFSQPVPPYPNGSDGVPDGEGASRGPATCSRSVIALAGWMHWGCITTGFQPGPAGQFDLGRLDLVPASDLTDYLGPQPWSAPLNTVVQDTGCELIDIFGHPVIGSVNGGQTPICGDLSVTLRVLQADINLDCAVNVLDQQSIAVRSGSTPPDAFYDSRYDMEPLVVGGDSDIDPSDVAEALGRNGSTCQVPIPPQPPGP